MSRANFSKAFEQLASFVAIARTKHASETVDELIKQCFVILPKDNLGTEQAIVDAVRSLFGIALNRADIALSVERLLKSGILEEISGGHLNLDAHARDIAEKRIQDARSLEEGVKNNWLEQICQLSPNLDHDLLWEALRVYLASAFRRHGIQAVAFIDPSTSIPSEYGESLSSMLEKSVLVFPADERVDAAEAISLFLSSVGSDRNRSQYIALLADSAFNYFSLTIAPEVSEHLREKLSPLILFLDTNFLFGILNLHANPQVDVSDELLDAVKKFKLPFKLRYHEATIREMENTLFFFSKELRRSRWQQKLSRAALSSGQLSGIELRYHELNAKSKIEPSDFFAPYDHWDVLLRERGIDVYKATSSEAALLERANLEAEYNEFLHALEIEKPVDAVQHDMAMLQTVQHLRTNAKSTLAAGALIVTCDYRLYTYKFRKSRSEGRRSCVILPNLFWQILRPFVTDDKDFDKAFAETFALPEFTLSRGGGSKAASKMLSILNGYKDFPEATAMKMLSNDVLLNNLNAAQDDKAFLSIIESEIVSNNEMLLEEKAAAEKQLSAERANWAVQAELERTKAKGALESAKSESDVALANFHKVQTAADEETRKREQAERRVASAELSVKRVKIAAGFLTAFLFVAVNLFALNTWPKWDFIITHPKSNSLQICFSLIIIFFSFSLWVKDWRKGLLVGGVLAVILVVLQIL